MKPETTPKTTTMAGILAALGVIYLVWGSTYLAIRLAIDTVPPFIMAGVRFSFAGLLLYGFARPRAGAAPTLAHWRSAAIVGCLMLVGGNGMVSWSEQYVPTGLAALLVGTVPLWMVILDWLLYRGPRPTPLMIAGLAVGLFGVYSLIGAPNLGGETVHPLGAAALMFACASWAFGSLQSRKANLPKSPLLAASIQMFAAGIALVILGTVCGEWSRFDLASVTLKSVLAIVYLSLFGSILAFSCYLWLLRVTTASRVATYAYVNPLVAILLGAIVMQEPVTQRVVIAGVAIILAVIMINLSKARAVATATPDQDSSTEFENRVGSGCEAVIVQRAAKVVECVPAAAAQPCDARSAAELDQSKRRLETLRRSTLT